MTITEEYALQYWQLGNVITGFVVLQAIAVMLSIGTSPEFVKNMAHGKVVVVPLIIVFHIIYAVAIWYCSKIEQSLLPSSMDQARHGLRMTLSGRWITVAAFASLLIGVTAALRKELEFVIRDVGGTNWSVARSNSDLRGRTRGRHTSHERVRVDAGVHRTLWDRVSPLSIDRAE